MVPSASFAASLPDKIHYMTLWLFLLMARDFDGGSLWFGGFRKIMVTGRFLGAHWALTGRSLSAHSALTGRSLAAHWPLIWRSWAAGANHNHLARRNLAPWGWSRSYRENTRFGAEGSEKCAETVVPNVRQL